MCFGPSLVDTWEQLKDFEYIFTCSGAHPFLIERGIVPTWHVAVDPCAVNTKTLIGQPHKDVEYLIASTCHPDVFDHLEGYKVTLWHVFDNAEDGLRALPRGEWALTGGCGVGLRAMTIARFFGFKDQHIFGMDGNIRANAASHAAPHPSPRKEHHFTEYMGVKYMTTPAYLEAARMTFHELNQMPDVKATFYGEGLVQAMAKNYVPEPVSEGKALIGFNKPELITPEFKELNAKLHRENLAYGVGGGKEKDTVLKLVANLKAQSETPGVQPSVLDYGCGKGYLAKALTFPIWEYDPAIPGKEESPRPADLVVCADVLEHVEPEKLGVVLDDLRRCIIQIGYFVIHTGPAQKTYSDGRNTHLTQQGRDWWEKRLGKFFQVGKIFVVGPELHVIVGPKQKQVEAKPPTPDDIAAAAKKTILETTSYAYPGQTK